MRRSGATPSLSAAESGSGGSYRRGDYWQIPARTITGDVEWPQADCGCGDRSAAGAAALRRH